MRILVVEDDPLLGRGTQAGLEQAGFAADWVRDGVAAETSLAGTPYQAVVLDLGLPRLGGLELLGRLRARGNRTPVLILTARDALDDRVKGLDLGADDYLTKPFNLPELEARVRAVVRRAHASASSELVHGPLRLDMAGRRLYCAGQPVELSARELAVIELLLLKEGRVVTKQQITEHLYGWEEGSTSNAVEVFIYRLRKKLEPSGADIRTVRGMGYLIDKPHAA